MEREDVARLFTQYGDDVFRLAYSYLASRPDAEDICQTVFLKLAEGRAVLEPGKEKAWLLTCTANACKSLLRSFWRRHRQELDENVPAAALPDPTVWQAVKALPPGYRAVVHLYYYEGYDQAEIAKLLHITPAAVRTRMYRARGQLQKELGEDDETTVPTDDGRNDAVGPKAGRDPRPLADGAGSP